MDKRRVIIEGVEPQIEAGRFPAKRIVGDLVRVTANIFTDGHDALAADLLYRRRDPAQKRWKRLSMTALVNDEWAASFLASELGFYDFTIEAWVDHFRSWRRDLKKKVDAGQDVELDLLVGSQLVEEASRRAEDQDREQLIEFSQFLKTRNDRDLKIQLALDEDLAQLIDRYPNKEAATRFDLELPIIVERERARFSSWYEFFPRSMGEGHEHGTFGDCRSMLERVAEMGFDVVYLPPIHPIGGAKRKGRNNAVEAGEGDVGSPWAIGASEGGHKSIHPQLGTVEEFEEFVRYAASLGVEIALDIAFQCSPDHPYVESHPEWFRKRPDGSVQYAENPPKKYEDIYPFDFESEDWKSLWQELKSVFEFWIDKGVKIFRVDNPHTKPFAFWEWLIGELRLEHPELIFLAEAFTRPKIMYRLAKLGFTQSYTYFAWRNTKWELTEYFHELTQTDVHNFFRPNAWPNTPDILTEYLQTGGRPAFFIRLILAATLSSNYGIYGPAFELCEAAPREPGSEEYLNSEKYEIKDWDVDDAAAFSELIGRINRIRRESPSLQTNETLLFHRVDNEQLLCFSKRALKGDDLIFVIVNLDPHHVHSGWVELPLEKLGIPSDRSYQVHDLLTDARFLWQGSRNYVELNPREVPAHIFRVRRRVRTEHDFEYFL